MFDDLPSASSPLATETNVFIATDYGVVTCVDLLTGEVQWIHEFDQGFYASPILVGDLVYLIDRSGVMRIFRDSDTFELLAEPSLGEKCTTTPAFVDNRIYIRGTAHLFAMGEAAQPPVEAGL
jgi:outer membrane protein assembly factor BamB